MPARARILAATAAAGWLAFAPPATAENASVLAAVQQRGTVRCGVTYSPGFAANDASGRPTGFMVELCRALAAAVLGNAEAIELRRLSKPQEFAALEGGEVDVSFAQTSWTFPRDALHRIDFGPPVFHDEQGIAAWPRDDGKPPLQAGGATVCVPAATTSHRVLEEYVARSGQPWRILPYPTWPDALQAFIGKECAALSTDRALLTAALRAPDVPKPGADIAALPVPTREPIAPVTGSADRAWVGIVRWTMFALMLAEEKGVTADNAAILRTTGGSEVQRLLQGIPEVAQRTGLRPDWAYQAITQVGNYGEIFERTVGERSPYHLPRGLNRPWSSGGLLYAPVFQ
ncbi:transporter substrate-binding domain-containing protein [Azospirillum sp. TSO22-1]|uniref:transporter substrate-binding domain-containing protein n=1 Tax=Azospirillum sp. TSO22-1 TaxID=716789 RepID=UPI001FFFD056|nr:transporter substrate-binding domain-containing protein [Azospirillum sp. TSO22-1]